MHDRSRHGDGQPFEIDVISFIRAAIERCRVADRPGLSPGYLGLPDWRIGKRVHQPQRRK